MIKQPTVAANVEAEIERVRSLGLDEIRAEWREMFSAPPPPALTKDLLGRIITYRIQEQAFGGLDRSCAKLLDAFARGKRPDDRMRRVKPGTVLVREYQGETHTVTVVPDGFIWREATYRSLSTIARAITGTAWNGPRFFGLRAKAGSELDISSLKAEAEQKSALGSTRAGRG